MKVLILDEWLPWPLESGKKIRTYNLISRLAERHKILYMAYIKLPEDSEKIRVMESHGIKIISVNDRRIHKWTKVFYFMVALNFLSKEPFSTAYHIRKEFIDGINLIIDREKPDLIHCEWTNLAPLLSYADGVPSIISAHNVESDIWKRFGIHGSNIFKRMLGRSQARKIERLERHWYPKADRCIAVSPEDQEVIRSYGAQVDLVDNGVDVEYYSSHVPSQENENSIIFTASFDTFSNQDGAEYFVRDIYPLIKKRKSNIQLWLVGREPSAMIRSFPSYDSSIHVTGTVVDVREYIAKATLCIVPLRIGGGSRLKILEAMAMKKAMISTSVGAEGLSVTHEKDILLADTPESFSRYVVEYLNDSTKRHSLGASGYSLVKAKYDWGHLAQRQDEIWLEVAKKMRSLE